MARARISSGRTLALRVAVIVGVFAAGAVSPGAVRPAAAQQVGLPLGTVPEPVVLEDLEGGSVDLAELIGTKPVLLEFWATWCPLCEALEPTIEAAHARYGDRVEFLIVGVAVNQSPRSVRRHIERDPMPGRVLWDADGAAVRAFKAPTTSYIVVLDAGGKVVYTGTGEDQDIMAAVGRAVGDG